MEPAEDLHAIVAPAPVFVDDTGRRGVLTRRAGRILVIGFTGYLGLMVVGFARDPRVGPIHLPTFGLPTLGLMTPPAPSVLGEQTSRTGSDADVEVATSGARADPAGAGYRPGRPESSPDGPEMAAGGTKAGAPEPLTSASGTPQPGLRLTPVGSPAGSATTTKATTRPSGAGSEPPATTTSSTTTATTGTSTATTTASSERGQGSEQGTGPVSAKGPDGSGAPGQQRRTATTTAG